MLLIVMLFHSPHHQKSHLWEFFIYIYGNFILTFMGILWGNRHRRCRMMRNTMQTVLPTQSQGRAAWWQQSTPLIHERRRRSVVVKGIEVTTIDPLRGSSSLPPSITKLRSIAPLGLFSLAWCFALSGISDACNMGIFFLKNRCKWILNRLNRCFDSGIY